MPGCQQKLTKMDMQILEAELLKLLSLMDVHALTFSMSPLEWRSVARILLKALEKRLATEGDLPLGKFLRENIVLSEEEGVTFECFN